MSDGTWFAGNHGPEGDWKTLKGRMLAPHEKNAINGDTPTTTSGQSNPPTDSWESRVIVSTGMTRGGGTMAK